VKAAILLVALAACTDSQLSAYSLRCEVTERDDQLLVSAMLYDTDRNIPATIDFDLQVDASMRDDHWTLTHIHDAAFGSWRSLSQPLAADEPVLLTLRGAGDAVDVTATAPDPMQLDDLPLFASRATPLTVTWGPAGTDPQTLEYNGPCARVELPLPADAASATIRYDMLEIFQAERTCTAELEIRRIREVPAGGPFAGGTVTFERDVSTTFASTP
jgi:hypothetical protein